MQTRSLAARQLGAASDRLRSPRLPARIAPSTVPARYLAVRSTRGGPGKDDEEKSWGEILGDAAGVAKAVLTKIKDTATSILPSGGKTEHKSDKPVRTARPEAPLAPTFGGGGGLLPNLLGRAMGGLLSSVVSGISAQLEAAAKESASAYEEASELLQGSAKLKSRLGTVTVGPVMSQSSSSSSINGVVSKQVVLLMPVYGSRGEGTAQVNVVDGPQRGGRTMQISVRTSDGAVIVVDDGRGGGGGGRGSVIDVEFREIDNKK